MKTVTVYCNRLVYGNYLLLITASNLNLSLLLSYLTGPSIALVAGCVQTQTCYRLADSTHTPLKHGTCTLGHLLDPFGLCLHLRPNSHQEEVPLSFLCFTSSNLDTSIALSHATHRGLAHLCNSIVVFSIYMALASL